jgi:hypothetical protein
MLLRKSNWWQLFPKYKCFDNIPPSLCPPTIGCPVHHSPSPLDPQASATTQHSCSYNCKVKLVIYLSFNGSFCRPIINVDCSFILFHANTMIRKYIDQNLWKNNVLILTKRTCTTFTRS